MGPLSAAYLVHTPADYNLALIGLAAVVLSGLGVLAAAVFGREREALSAR